APGVRAPPARACSVLPAGGTAPAGPGTRARPPPPVDRVGRRERFGLADREEGRDAILDPRHASQRGPCQLDGRQLTAADAGRRVADTEVVQSAHARTRATRCGYSMGLFDDFGNAEQPARTRGS